MKLSDVEKQKPFSVDIIYLARGLDYGIEQVKAFFASYKKHTPFACGGGVCGA